ncbi:hypothetical protein JYU34_002673 [Plutella xylostella]|uniref:Centrosomin N-terminal motif 1 domain-containing protein n=1 Tax=Plutella xylostella TaxID=51655 RepID=A0ABQ7R2Z9_PLUXY|nr:hypothetical protein JYU34_002673 [Plutella xylostella]
MATLPRMHSSKHGGNIISSPFSTSPRKLQEMLPTGDGHDVTAASGVSMKQYEDQLNGLRKENFHLKLRVYFLEEKLGTGAPPAVQGLLEHNVRLQVEVEELRRQLAAKQELLAAAAEAIDVLEQQGSISADSIEASLENCTVSKKDHVAKEETYLLKSEQTCEDTCLESESAGEMLGKTVTVKSDDELPRLRRENRKALQMIKGCMKKIQQQDKEIKKLKLDKELVYAHVSDSQLEKYEEIVKCKDQHIKDLETKIKELQTNAENIHDDESGNLQELLTRRLQGLAFFLDKLLSHKCVLGEDKKRLAESILEQSLALPVGLKLDESMAPDDFTMDESNIDISQSLRIEDLTAMFGHHLNCSEEGKRGGRRGARGAGAGELSESECWSEPDRQVSLARMGLLEAEREPDAARPRRRTRLSHASRDDDDALAAHIQQLQAEKKDLDSQLDYAKQQIGELMAEKSVLNETLAAERANLVNAIKSTLAFETKWKEAEERAARAAEGEERARGERLELEAAHAEVERALRRAADEAAVQASQAALERARAQTERLRAERERDDARQQLGAEREAAAEREVAAAAAAAAAAARHQLQAPPSDDERPTSPDQGIDSDRLSSLEQNDGLTLSPRSLYEENVTLKQKLARTKATLADTLTQLNAANMRKRSVQRAICREIHKTQGVLRKARDQFENQNQ